MSHRLLTAAAARLLTGTASATTPAPAAPAPAPAPAVAPAAAVDGEVPVDVVTVADAQAAVAQAQTASATAERERTAAVFASDAGKANYPMAAFMLNANPTASAESIIATLATMPAAAAPAPAPAATTTAAPTPPAPAAITTNLNETPRIVVGTEANQGGGEEVDADKFWSSAISGANASLSSPFGADIAPGLPRTGN